MKRITAVLLLMCLFKTVNADVSARVVSIEKAVEGNDVRAIVTTEYTLPDGYKKNMTTRYDMSSITKAKVLEDIKSQVNTIIKYYIKENQEALKYAEETKFNDFIALQQGLSVANRITSLTYTVSGTTDTATGLYLNAQGTVLSNYK